MSQVSSNDILKEGITVVLKQGYRKSETIYYFTVDRIDDSRVYLKCLCSDDPTLEQDKLWSRDLTIENFLRMYEKIDGQILELLYGK